MLTRRVEARMRPGRDSDEGFLGPTERLKPILEADRKLLAELGIRRQDLAARLRQLIDGATSGTVQHSDVAAAAKPELRSITDEVELTEEPEPGVVRVEDRFDVELTLYWGWQDCPWRGPRPLGCGRRYGYYATLDWTIQNLRTRQQLEGPGLLVHLIEVHGFFEGRESPYRVDPDELARLLQLGPYRG